MEKSPLKMQPVYKETVWGGTALREHFGKDIPTLYTGESWEIAAHTNGQSKVSEGYYTGITLGALLEEFKEELVGKSVWERYGSYFPLMIKFIDANDNLSVQVHPDDTYASIYEGERGKTEMWYVLDAKPGAKLVYGFNRELSREEYKRAIQEGTLEEILNWVEVSPGDVFFIPAGTLHAIGGGLLIAEIQQNSDTTYRVYDYNRMGLDGKPRTLHVDKAVDVTLLNNSKGRERADIRNGISCEHFETIQLHVKGETQLKVSSERFEILICLSGQGRINDMNFIAGDTILLPASLGDCIIDGAAAFLQTHVSSMKM